MATNPESENLAEAGGSEPLPQPSGGLIARHWRGDYSLVRSYWRHGVLLNNLAIQLVGAILMTIILNLLQGRGVLVLVLGLGEMALLVAAWAWVCVGIWRAAGKYKGPRIWAILARIVIVLSVLQAIANISMTVNTISRAMTSHEDIYVPGRSGQQYRDY